MAVRKRMRGWPAAGRPAMDKHPVVWRYRRLSELFSWLEARPLMAGIKQKYRS